MFDMILQGFKSNRKIVFKRKAQWVKVPLTKCDGLNWIPGTHNGKRELTATTWYGILHAHAKDNYNFLKLYLLRTRFAFYNFVLLSLKP